MAASSAVLLMRAGGHALVCVEVLRSSGHAVGARLAREPMNTHECEIGTLAHIGPATALAGNLTVGEGSLVRIGARVTPGRRIGGWSTVGAGAVLVDDVPAGTTVVGVPARPLPRPQAT